MLNILIGTSGYSYIDWVGPVYPPGTSDKDFLKHYTGQFNFTELNFTYYRQPDPRTIDRLVHISPDFFRFSVKAHQSLTHNITDNFKHDSVQFKQGIAPLIEASKLSAVVLQFPFSYHYNPSNRKYLQAVCEEFSGVPLAVEFRNAQWCRDSVFNGLKKYRAAIVNVDEPDLDGLIKPASVVTSDFAYVRFHGRNKENWWTGDNAGRYDYSYSDDELSEWVPRIRDMAEKAGTVLVAFNNHWKGQAVRNAKKLREMLGERLDC